MGLFFQGIEILVTFLLCVFLCIFIKKTLKFSALSAGTGIYPDNVCVRKWFFFPIHRPSHSLDRVSGGKLGQTGTWRGLLERASWASGWHDPVLESHLMGGVSDK